ncbi:hypothetical protein IWQ60_006302 [Tieghemiomyces parasiticus]|uniref:Uncharacterized protein n=1 Tax=Tieghemiomyces parasiticus TaxID=78921 RepID=A0A9W8DTU2_9FUNG|nr:hypothetical protein IWQ60_006302 [Tieghemiomyces parasiticus]
MVCRPVETANPLPGTLCLEYFSPEFDFQASQDGVLDAREVAEALQDCFIPQARFQLTHHMTMWVRLLRLFSENRSNPAIRLPLPGTPNDHALINMQTSHLDRSTLENDPGFAALGSLSDSQLGHLLPYVAVLCRADSIAWTTQFWLLVQRHLHDNAWLSNLYTASWPEQFGQRAAWPELRDNVPLITPSQFKARTTLTYLAYLVARRDVQALAGALDDLVANNAADGYIYWYVYLLAAESILEADPSQVWEQLNLRRPIDGISYTSFGLASCARAWRFDRAADALELEDPADDLIPCGFRDQPLKDLKVTQDGLIRVIVNVTEAEELAGVNRNQIVLPLGGI